MKQIQGVEMERKRESVVGCVSYLMSPKGRNTNNKSVELAVALTSINDWVTAFSL